MYSFITILHITALALLVWETAYAVMQRPSKIQVYLIIVTLCTIVMLVGYQVEISSTNESVALAGCAFSYLGKPFALLATTLFIVNYCGYKVPRKLVLPIIAYNAYFPVLVFTNELHHLYYATVSYEPSAVFSGLHLTHGPLYSLYTFTVVAYLIVDVIFVVIAFRKAKTKREYLNISYFCMIIASAMLGFLIYLTGITGGYDTTMAGCVLGSIFLFIMYTRFKLFDFVSIAKDLAIDDAQSGILVIGRDGSVEYENKLMKQLHEATFSYEEILGFEDGDTKVHKGDLVYDVHKKLIETSGEVIGSVVQINDVTASYNYSQKLEHEVAERVAELQHVQRKVIAGFTNIVEARDGKTGDHIKNTVQFVKLICDGMQEKGVYTEELTQKFIDYLLDAAPLHDIGKISISDTILLKPGRLTREEFHIMKTHTTIGRDIIENTMRGVENDEYIDIAKAVCYFHHEKWIGGGYPEGIEGEAIPLAARIMALADVYDALISERCYKPAMSSEEALGIIRDGRGTHFDPVLTDIFIEKIQELE